MQLFLLYAGGPYIGLRLSATAAGVLGLGALFLGLFRRDFPRRLRRGAGRPDRGGDQRRHDAAATLMRVRLPGALIAAVPPIVNTLIVLSKETVVLSIITVPELMYQMQTMAAETFTAFDAIFAMAVFYWLLVEVVSRLGRRVEARVTAFLARTGMSVPMIEIRGVGKSFGAHQVLRGVDLTSRAPKSSA